MTDNEQPRAAAPMGAHHMDFWTTVAGFSDDIRGAFAGGVMAALLDTGPWWQRLARSGASCLFAVATSAGIVEILGLSPSGNTRAFIAAWMTLLGIILAVGLQRTLKRLLNIVGDRAGGIVDRVVERFVGGGSK